MDNYQNLYQVMSPELLLDINYSNKSIMFVENNKLYFKNFKNESIEILELQAEGKKIMKSSDFLRGNKL